MLLYLHNLKIVFVYRYVVHPFYCHSESCANLQPGSEGLGAALMVDAFIGRAKSVLNLPDLDEDWLREVWRRPPWLRFVAWRL